MIPATIVVIALFLFLVNLGRIFGFTMNETAQTAITLAVPVVYIIFVMLVRKSVVNKITIEQSKAIQEIKDYFGDNKFEALLKEQRTYIDEYFANQKEAEETPEETKEDGEKNDDALETKIEEDDKASSNETEKLE
jgi:hypothetical protein